jgi:hypothetical protein
MRRTVRSDPCRAGGADRLDRGRDGCADLDVDVEAHVGEAVEGFGQRAIALTVPEVDAAQLGRGQMTDRRPAADQALEVGIVADHGDAVGRDVHVGLDVRHTDGEGLREGEQGVLRRIDREAAMCQHPRGSGREEAVAEDAIPTSPQACHPGRIPR